MTIIVFVPNASGQASPNFQRHEPYRFGASPSWPSTGSLCSITRNHPHQGSDIRTTKMLAWPPLKYHLWSIAELAMCPDSETITESASVYSDKLTQNHPNHRKRPKSSSSLWTLLGDERTHTLLIFLSSLQKKIMSDNVLMVTKDAAATPEPISGTCSGIMIKVPVWSKLAVGTRPEGVCWIHCLFFASSRAVVTNVLIHI